MPKNRYLARKKLAARPLEGLVHIIRGQRVMLDSDLASLYEVPTKVLNQSLRRNLERFPEDFAFQLSKDELEKWRSQVVTSNPQQRWPSGALHTRLPKKGYQCCRLCCEATAPSR
jgi:hypothetical protein